MALQVHGGALGVHTAVDARGICALSRAGRAAQRHRGAAEQGGGRARTRSATRRASTRTACSSGARTTRCIDPAAIGHARGTEIVAIVQSFFIGPKAPTAGGWIWGAGPALSLPTGGDGLTSDKFSIGPTAVVLKQDSGWTYGALANQLWSVSGDDDKDVSSLYLQPFLFYTTKKNTTFGINTESSYNWKDEEWTVPINLTVSQLVKFGKQPVSLQLGYRNYVDTPTGGPDWGLRFQVTFLFPK